MLAQAANAVSEPHTNANGCTVQGYKWSFAFKTTFPDASIAAVNDTFSILWAKSDEDCSTPPSCSSAVITLSGDRSPDNGNEVYIVDGSTFGASEFTIDALGSTVAPTECNSVTDIVLDMGS